MYSVEEYLELEKSSPDRHEYVGGALYAFAGSSERHNRIALSVAAKLLGASTGGPCRVYMSDVKLRAAEDVIYYPDVMVTCDPDDSDAYVKHLPCVVVEVLSPTTQSVDLREKLLTYRGIPSLRLYLVLSQDERKATAHSKNDDGSWWTQEQAGTGTVSFPCPEVDLTLDEIYEGILA